MEMVALFVGYFLYESNADDWWWTAYWLIIALQLTQRIVKNKAKLLRKKVQEK